MIGRHVADNQIVWECNAFPPWRMPEQTVGEHAHPDVRTQSASLFADPVPQIQIPVSLVLQERLARKVGIKRLAPFATAKSQACLL